MAQIEQLPTESLIPYARNSRTHSDAQVAQVAASIREFGFTNPVLVDADNGIIAGHGRVLAARKLGLAEVPCIRLAHLSETQKRAYIIADNKLALNAGWDNELLALEFGELQELGLDLDLTGFDADELEALAGLVGDDGDDDAPGAAPAGSLADRFLLPPFTVLNAREGWWQDRKRAWLALGIRSELGRGDCAPGGAPMPLDRPGGGANERPDLGQRGGDATRHAKPVPRAEPGGSARPAMNYSKNKARGDGRGRAMQ